METYEKYIINDGVLSNSKNIKYVIDAITLINDISSLSTKRMSAKKKQEKLNSIMKQVNVLISRIKTKPVYKKMIRCGVNAAIEEYNRKQTMRLFK
jgi:hypothetical protein